MKKEKEVSVNDIVARANLIIISHLFDKMSVIYKKGNYDGNKSAVKKDILWENIGISRSIYSRISRGHLSVPTSTFDKFKNDKEMLSILKGKHLLQFLEKGKMKPTEIEFDDKFYEKIDESIDDILAVSMDSWVVAEGDKGSIEAYCLKWMTNIINNRAKNIEMSPDYIFENKVKPFVTLEFNEIATCKPNLLKKYYNDVKKIYNEMTTVLNYNEYSKGTKAK